MAEQGYAGDRSPRQAWDMIRSEPRRTFLVDVRTEPEWRYVGVPDLSSLGGAPVLISWQLHPDNRINPDFAAEIAAAGIRPDDTVLFLCRSGARSRAAARAMSAAGFQRAYNVSEGFEGPLDEAGHRGTVGGWKAAGLPWKQE